MPERLIMRVAFALVVQATMLPGIVQGADLIVTAPVMITVPATYDNVFVNAGGILTADAPLTVLNDMTVADGGIVTHSVRNLSGLQLNVGGTLDVQAGGSIDVTARGLLGANAGSAFGLLGEVFSDAGDSAVIVAGAEADFDSAPGASYGGRGAPTTFLLPSNAVYGRLELPHLLGSGASVSLAPHAPALSRGGNGGGMVTITTGACVIDGRLQADGGSGTRGGSGGSGGSIFIRTSNLSGSGSISARGGEGNIEGFDPGLGLPGGGGRIEVISETSTFPDTGFDASGATIDGRTSAAAGTIYLSRSTTAHGDLVIDNKDGVPFGGAATPLRTDSMTFRSIVIRNRGSLLALPMVDSASSVPYFIQQGGLALPDGAQLTLDAGVRLVLLGPDGLSISGGTLGGVGAISAALASNSGTISPGAGVLTLDCAFRQTAQGVLTMKIPTGASPPQQSVLDIGGAASLAGKLNLTFSGDVVPSEGSRFTLINYVSRSGTFDSLSVPDSPALPPYLKWVLTYGRTALTAEVVLPTDVSVVPSEPVPLGEPCTIDITSPSGTDFDSASLFYSPGSRVIGFREVPMTSHPGVAGLSADIPGEVIGEAGVDYYVRYSHAGIVGFVPTQGADNPLSLQVQRPSVGGALRTRAQSESGFEIGQSLSVLTALVPSGLTFVSGNLHYRRGGDSAYTAVPLALGSDFPIPQAAIPGADVGPGGVEYWVEVNTLTDTLRAPRSGWLDRPYVVRTRMLGLGEDSTYPARRYRAVSFPVDFGPTFTGDLGSILRDRPEFGSYDPTRWRAFRWSPDLKRNGEFSPADTADFRPRPGMAYWLISAVDHRVDFAPTEAFSTPTDTFFSIVIAPGWNQIGDPFAFPVAWDSVQKHSAVGDPFPFDPEGGTMGDYAPNPASVLVPFAGYFVENSSARPETLLVPPRRAPVPTAAPTGAVRAQGSGSREAWRIRLQVRGEGSVDGANVFGVAPGASDEYDPLDRSKPPQAPGQWVRLSFEHPDWHERADTYRCDIRSSAASGHVWEVELRSAVAGEPMTLSLAPEDSLPADLFVRLVDREQAAVVDLTDPPGQLSSYRILSYGPTRPYRFAIVAGTPDYVSSSGQLGLPLPSRVELGPITPNPSAAPIRVRFGLPKTDAVTLEVFSVTGQRITSLLRNDKLAAGYHSPLWAGTNERGLRAPSGVYFVRLKTSTNTLMSRVVLMR